jgi:hypothetical protein
MIGSKLIITCINKIKNEQESGIQEDKCKKASMKSKGYTKKR